MAGEVVSVESPVVQRLHATVAGLAAAVFELAAAEAVYDRDWRLRVIAASREAAEAEFNAAFAAVRETR